MTQKSGWKKGGLAIRESTLSMIKKQKKVKDGNLTQNILRRILREHRDLKEKNVETIKNNRNTINDLKGEISLLKLQNSNALSENGKLRSQNRGMNTTLNTYRRQSQKSNQVINNLRNNNNRLSSEIKSLEEQLSRQKNRVDNLNGDLQKEKNRSQNILNLLNNQKRQIVSLKDNITRLQHNKNAPFNVTFIEKLTDRNFKHLIGLSKQHANEEFNIFVNDFRNNSLHGNIPTPKSRYSSKLEDWKLKTYFYMTQMRMKRDFKVMTLAILFNFSPSTVSRVSRNMIRLIARKISKINLFTQQNYIDNITEIIQKHLSDKICFLTDTTYLFIQKSPKFRASKSNLL